MLILWTAQSKFLSTPSARRATQGRSCAGPRVPISIHALREEGDCEANNLSYVFIKFLSTPSARRATANYPALKEACMISIHALREEGDKK